MFGSGAEGRNEEEKSHTKTRQKIKRKKRRKKERKKKKSDYRPDHCDHSFSFIMNATDYNQGFVCRSVWAILERERESERENFIINRSWSDSPTCALNHGHPPIALTLGCGGRSLDTRANIAPGVSCRVLLGHRRRHRVS